MAAQVQPASAMLRREGQSIKAICKGKVSHSRQQSEDSCIFCQRKVRQKELPQIIQRSLYDRHCSSVNYYYTKDIKRIIYKQRCRDTTLAKDFELFDTKSEQLTAFYALKEFGRNFEAQWRYHQFNIDQPRVFERSIFSISETHYGAKRKLQERAIRRMLDALSDSELERCDLNLEPYMKEVVQIEECRHDNNDLLKDVYQPYALMKRRLSKKHAKKTKNKKVESLKQDSSYFSMKLSLSYICRQQNDCKVRNIASLFEQQIEEKPPGSISQDMWTNPNLLPGTRRKLSGPSFLDDRSECLTDNQDSCSELGPTGSNWAGYDHISSSKAMVDKISAAFSRARDKREKGPISIVVATKQMKTSRQASESQKAKKPHQKSKSKGNINHSKKSSENTPQLPERIVVQNSPKQHKSKRLSKKRQIDHPLASMAVDRSGSTRKLASIPKLTMSSSIWPSFGVKSVRNLHQSSAVNKPMLKKNCFHGISRELLRTSLGLSATQLTSRDKSGLTQKSVKKKFSGTQIFPRATASRHVGSKSNLNIYQAKRSALTPKGKEMEGFKRSCEFNVKTEDIMEKFADKHKGSSIRLAGSILKNLNKGSKFWPQNDVQALDTNLGEKKKKRTKLSPSKSQEKLQWAKQDKVKDTRNRKVAALKEKFIEETQKVLKNSYRLAFGARDRQNASPREGYRSLNGLEKHQGNLYRSRSRLSTQRSLVSDSSDLARALSMSCRPKNTKNSQRRKSIGKLLPKKKKQEA